MSMTAAARALSADLAELLGQGIRREGRAFIVPSRTRRGMAHRVDVALDGALYCNCEAAAFRLECWAVKLVREELEMSETALQLVPIQLNPRTSLLASEHEMALIDRSARMIFAGAIALPRELNTPEKVAAVMLYGLELGLAPMTAIKHLNLINGRVEPDAQIMVGMLRSRHPDAQLSVVKLDTSVLKNGVCTMRLVWPSRKVDDTYTVTWADIERAKLDRDNNMLYPKDRLLYHCTKRLMRIYAPDVINGLDQSAPVLAAPRADDDYDVIELYNEGDGPAYIDGQVIDCETGEIVDEQVSAPPPTRPAPPVPGPTNHGATQQQASATARGADSGQGDNGAPLNSTDVATAASAAPPDTDLPAARARLVKRVQEVKSSLDGRAWNPVNVELHRDFPNVWEGDTLAAPRLDAETIARMDAVLRRALGEPEEVLV